MSARSATAVLEVTARSTLVGTTARSSTPTLVLASWNVRSRTRTELALLYDKRNIVAIDLEVGSLGLVVSIGSLEVDKGAILFRG